MLDAVGERRGRPMRPARATVLWDVLVAADGRHIHPVYRARVEALRDCRRIDVGVRQRRDDLHVDAERRDASAERGDAVPKVSAIRCPLTMLCPALR